MFFQIVLMSTGGVGVRTSECVRKGGRSESGEGGSHRGSVSGRESVKEGVSHGGSASGRESVKGE